jgi:hypothetical protein
MTPESQIMASRKQIEANRKNGPLASSRNAIRHGLTATQLVVSVEEKAEFQPVGILQRSLVDQIVAARWRLGRLREIETGYFEIRLTTGARRLEEDFPDLEGTAKLAVAVQDDAVGYHALTNLPRYESRIERSFYRALHELQRLRSAPAGPPKGPPDAVLPNEPNSAPSRSYRSPSIGCTDGANHAGARDATADVSTKTIIANGLRTSWFGAVVPISACRPRSSPVYNSGYAVTMKTAVSLPDDLFRQAKATARRLGVSRNELYAKAIAEFLKRREGHTITELLNDLYSRRSAKVDSALDRAQLKSLG